MRLSQRLNGIRPGNLLPDRPIPVPLGEWLPDFPQIQNPGATTAYNVVPKETGIYGPWRKPVVESTNSMDARATGSILALSDDLVAYNYIGNATKLYEYAGKTFTDASKGGGYTAAGAVSWDFARFDNLVLATNLADEIQSVVVGDGGTTGFADHIVSTVKPRAVAMATVGNFLVLANTIDATDGTRPRRVWWSAFGDSSDFEPSATTQSDFEDIKDGGQCTSIVGGAEYGVVFQDASVTRITYIGPPVIFRFDPVDRLRGCRYKRTIVSHGRLIFYYSDEGFMMFDGTTSRPIGAGKVDRTFAALLSPDKAVLLTAVKDPARNLVMWAIPEGTEQATRVFIFNWTTQRWSEGQVNFSEMMLGVSPGTLVDDLGGVIIDDEPFASSLIDSGEFRGGQLRLGGIDENFNMAWLTGLPRAASVGSTEGELFPGNKAQIRAVKGFADGDPLIQLAFREKQTDNVQTTDEVPLGPLDVAPFRDKMPAARYVSARMNFPADQEWDNARSFEVWADQRGIR